MKDFSTTGYTSSKQHVIATLYTTKFAKYHKNVYRVSKKKKKKKIAKKLKDETLKRTIFVVCSSNTLDTFVSIPSIVTRVFILFLVSRIEALARTWWKEKWERRRGAILRVIGRRRSDVARGSRGIYARQAPQENSGGKKVGRRISIPWNLITRFIEDLWNAFRARGEVFRIRFYARLDRINYNPRVIFEFYTISNLFEIQWENLDRMFRWLLEASPWNSNVHWKNRLWYLLKNNPLYSREFYCYYRFIRY